MTAPVTNDQRPEPDPPHRLTETEPRLPSEETHFVTPFFQKAHEQRWGLERRSAPAVRYAARIRPSDSDACWVFLARLEGDLGVDPELTGGIMYFIWAGIPQEELEDEKSLLRLTLDQRRNNKLNEISAVRNSSSSFFFYNLNIYSHCHH